MSEQIRATVLDPTTNLALHPVSAATMTHFGIVPLADLRNPFDRFILATAMQLNVPLVTADHAINDPAPSTSSGDDDARTTAAPPLLRRYARARPVRPFCGGKHRSPTCVDNVGGGLLGDRRTDVHRVR